MISNSGPVGAMYASAFPERVRAMVIDSTVAPDFADYLIERPSEQQASYELRPAADSTSSARPSRAARSRTSAS